ncbi:MAG TPA: pseudouridine synthase [Syntrophobacteraceae bacterium]|nr:pseudouridine synthase [Syntrophobacteraceae bacterium]
MKTLRLHKLMAQTGVASRRTAEQMILNGRVKVNGEIVTSLGMLVDPERDTVLVDQKPLRPEPAKSYLLIYKPKKCVTTLRDPQGRKTVADFVKNLKTRIFPVGRLDYDAEGLLILTNDGELANRLQHPRFGVHKIYEVKVSGLPAEGCLARLRSGVQLEEGLTAPAQVEILRTLPRACWLRIELGQGWNRQIKRMCEAVGHPVIKLKRVGFGPLRLEQLRPGSCRPLTKRELGQLCRAVGLDQQDESRFR